MAELLLQLDTPISISSTTAISSYTSSALCVHAPLSRSIVSVSFTGKSILADADSHFNKLLTGSGFISRCACLVFWINANYDPCICGQWGTVPCLWVQPETYDETNRFLLIPPSRWRTRDCLKGHLNKWWKIHRSHDGLSRTKSVTYF